MIIAHANRILIKNYFSTQIYAANKGQDMTKILPGWTKDPRIASLPVSRDLWQNKSGREFQQRMLGQAQTANGRKDQDQRVPLLRKSISISQPPLMVAYSKQNLRISFFYSSFGRYRLYKIKKEIQLQTVLFIELLSNEFLD